MSKGSIQILYGEGRGKSTAAMGRAIQAAAQGKNVFIIQFLKEKNEDIAEFMKRLEPEVKFFRFEKKDENYDDLSEEERAEERMNILNGMNFAKKVLVTGECNLLILDEVLGLIDHGVITEDVLESLLGAKSEETDIILTGRVLTEQCMNYADEVCQIVAEK